MKDVAELIRESVLAHRPVIIRHHYDADGTSGGILIDKACRSLIPEKKKIDLYIIRRPTTTPFYDVSDALRDISTIKRLQKGEPLLILIDFGSTEESFNALKIMKGYAKEIIIIDHHPPTVHDGVYSSDGLATIHLNPYKTGGDKNLTAGIQCFEIAKLIHKDPDITLAAISAMGDKSNLAEYLKGSGRSTEEILKLKICFDFLGFTLRNDPVTELFDEILGDNDLRKNIYEGLGIEDKLEKLMESVVVNDGAITVAEIDLTGQSYRYPPPGALTGLVFDRLLQRHPRLIVLGLFGNSIIIRESEAMLPVSKLIALLSKDFPEAQITGGGHDVAGTISMPLEFIQAAIEKTKGHILQIR